MRDLQERRAVEPALTTRPSLLRALTPAVAAAVAAADQVSKTWAVHGLGDGATRHVAGTLDFVLTYNTGAAFGLGNGITPIVEAVVVVLIAGLMFLSQRATRSGGAVEAVAIGLLLGGALSNLGDRVFRHLPGHPGAVVDFIQAVSWWPIFNVADASIVVGVAILIVKYGLTSSARAGRSV